MQNTYIFVILTFATNFLFPRKSLIVNQFKFSAKCYEFYW